MSPLSSEEKTFLLRLARQTLESRLCGEGPPVAALAPSKSTPALRAPAGAFVSLHKQGELRGCVGMVEPRLPLYRAVMEAALSAAFADPRFPVLRASELGSLEIEISVLSPSRAIAPEQIQIGVHGLIVTQGRARGLLLPQVAVERGWGAEQFLEETCRKAGLARDAWRTGTKLEAFQAEVFGENSSPAESRPG
jgi:AmmeMemoRadiSam system protein A